MAPEPFFEQVYQVVCLVPEGRVTTYGAIANYLTVPGAARMVGWAMKIKWVTEKEEPELHQMVTELAEVANIPKLSG